MAGVIFDGNTVAPAILVEKEITKTKFGASVDTWLGDVDENGVLQQTTWTGVLNFAGVKEIGMNGLYYVFGGRNNITGVDFSSLTTIGDHGLFRAFQYCDNITTVNFPSLTTVGDAGMYDAFQYCDNITTVNFPSLTTVGDEGMGRMFYSCKKITSVVFPSLTTVERSGMAYAFYDCDNITSVNFPSLTTVGNYGMNYAFYYCSKITSAVFPSLTTVGDYGMQYAFRDGYVLTNIDLSSLTTVGYYGLAYAFYVCRVLAKISFPSLTSVVSTSFGSSTLNCAFRDCLALTEIHFRADMQATIEAMSQYANKWGAKNATIYFDLIGTITVNGVAYARDEKQSIRVDGTKTFVGWKDADGNVVYTSYANNAEPAVGTVAYSDAGTTQVGTVEGVA